MTVVQSEKCGAIWGSAYDKIRMITARFARMTQRSIGHLSMYFLSIFQLVRAMIKTCNQFYVIELGHSAEKGEFL
jgi:hypothetical protein